MLDLDRQFPGMRFRMIDEQDGIRRHIRIFVNGEPAASLAVALEPDDEIQIICAISGGSH
jgi:sulfur-carrier protein